MRRGLRAVPASSSTCAVDAIASSGAGPQEYDNSETGPVQAIPSSSRPSARLAEITTLLNDLLRTSEEKVNLAKATYDSVRH